MQRCEVVVEGPLVDDLLIVIALLVGPVVPYREVIHEVVHVSRVLLRQHPLDLGANPFQRGREIPDGVEPIQRSRVSAEELPPGSSNYVIDMLRIHRRKRLLKQRLEAPSGFVRISPPSDNS